MLSLAILKIDSSIMAFPVVTYGCERWTMKKAECWRTDAIKLKNWWWRLLDQISQSRIVIGRTIAKAPILWPLGEKSWLTGKDSDAGRDGGQEEKGKTEDEMAGWHHGLDGCVWVNSRSWWWTGRPGVLRLMGSQRVGHDWATELNWTNANPSDIKG